jgi:glycosyltransferase involved in cell wall biosynthesis
MSVYFDLSEFLTNPLRTGIQRVTAELCLHWPDPTELIPVRITRDERMVRLPGNALAAVEDYFRRPAYQIPESLTRIQEMIGVSESGPHVPLARGDSLVCSEVFWDPVRINFYEGRPTELHCCYCFLIHDLLPMTHPQYFAPDPPHEIICRYFRLIRNVPNVAFTSKATQQAYYGRLLRESKLRGPTIRLGSDGLGPRRQSGHRPLPAKRFVVACTIEPRKNHALVLDAFEPILAMAPEVELLFVGRVGWADPKLITRIERLQQRYPNFRVFCDVDDGTMRHYVESARATIFVSAAEGFGLPAVESLWLGTPVIASDDIPSLEKVTDDGTCRVSPLTEDRLRQAVLAFLDDDFYRRKAAEARGITLPAWSDFAAGIADWVREARFST